MIENNVISDSSIAYELTHDSTWGREDGREDGLEYDAWLRKFSKSENLRFTGKEIEFPIGNGKQGTLPEPFEFDAVDKFLQFIDYPYTDQRLWPIMSRKMLETLESVGDFPYQAFPVEMIDSRRVFDKNSGKSVKSGIVNHDFMIVHLLEHLDFFDWDQSRYTLRSPKKVDRATEVILKEPADGFPPLFRLSAFRSGLFVSAKAKTALETSEIRGIKLIPLEKCRF